MKGFRLFTSQNKPTDSERSEIVDFLFLHLGKYGDEKEAISECMKFALKETPKAIGGCIAEVRDDRQQLVAAAILNETGMAKFIPENILVYIAVHEDTRGKGIGKQLVKELIKATEGDMALHVDATNPAKGLYEHLGFSVAYLEMRYKRQ